MTRPPKRGEVPADPAVHSANLTEADLREHLSLIEQQVASIATQRADLSVAAIAGNIAAHNSIELLDRERERFRAQRETVQDALAKLQEQYRNDPAERIKQGYLRGRHRLQGLLVSNIRTRYDGTGIRLLNLINIHTNLDIIESVYRGGDVVGGLREPGVEGIPYAAASELTRETYFQAQYDRHRTLKGNEESLARIKRDLEAAEWCTGDLLASITLPRLPDYLRDFPETLVKLRMEYAERSKVDAALTAATRVWTIRTNIPA